MDNKTITTIAVAVIPNTAARYNNLKKSNIFEIYPSFLKKTNASIPKVRK